MTDLERALQHDTYTLAHVNVPSCVVSGMAGPIESDANGLFLADIGIESGRISGLAAHDPTRLGDGRVDLGGRMAWPCPIDIHTHLDKGHIWPRAANPDGTFMGALETVRADRIAHWSATDVRARFEFGLRCAYAHGTCAIRTHLDSIPPQDAITWPLFAELRERWAGRIALQGVSLAMPEHYRGPEGDALARRVAEHGGILGLVPQMTPELDDDLDRFLTLAERHGLAVDCHVDETGDPAAQTLRHLTRAVLRRRFVGGVTVGHCCSLARQEPDEARRTLDLVADAGIAVVSLPMCNMYLQDRVPSRTPRWRGVTLAHEIDARGIPLAFASDNCRDPFYAYGDHDMHEVFREAVRIAHLDHPFADWAGAVTTVPATIMGLEAGSLELGRPADLVLYEGRSWSEALSRPETRRTVLRDGRPVDTTPPAYAELDHLFA